MILLPVPAVADSQPREEIRSLVELLCAGDGLASFVVPGVAVFWLPVGAAGTSAVARLPVDNATIAVRVRVRP